MKAKKVTFLLVVDSLKASLWVECEIVFDNGVVVRRRIAAHRKVTLDLEDIEQNPVDQEVAE